MKEPRFILTIDKSLTKEINKIENAYCYSDEEPVSIIDVECSLGIKEGNPYPGFHRVSEEVFYIALYNMGAYGPMNRDLITNQFETDGVDMVRNIVDENHSDSLYIYDEAADFDGYVFYLGEGKAIVTAIGSVVGIMDVDNDRMLTSEDEPELEMSLKLDITFQGEVLLMGKIYII